MIPCFVITLNTELYKTRNMLKSGKSSLHYHLYFNGSFYSEQ